MAVQEAGTVESNTTANNNESTPNAVKSSSSNSGDAVRRDEAALNDVIVVYDYDPDVFDDDVYDISMDGILLNGCSQYLFKFSIIVLPIIFVLVIVVGLFEREEDDYSELRCRIGQAFIVVGISVGLLALYFLCRYGCHVRQFNRESNDRRRQRENVELGHNVARQQRPQKRTPSKQQLKFILQNPWHRISSNEPKQPYSNNIDLYKQNGLYLDYGYIEVN